MESPREWKGPQWKRGDSEEQFKLLQEVAVGVVDTDAGLRVELDQEEEGFLCIRVFVAEREVGEVYVVDSDKFKVWSHSDTEEHLDEPQAVVTRLIELSTEVR